MANNTDAGDLLREELIRRRRVIDISTDSWKSSDGHDDSDGQRRSFVETLEFDKTPQVHDMLVVPGERHMESRLTSASSSYTDRSEMKSAKLNKLKAKIRDKLLLSKTAKIIDSAGRKVSFMESTDSLDPEEKTLQHRLEQQALRRAESGNGKILCPSTEEAYNFFTSTWNEDLLTSPLKSPDFSLVGKIRTPPGSPEERPSTSKDPPKSDDVIENTPINEETDEGLGVTDRSQLLVSELLELEDRWQLFHYVPALYRPHSERLVDDDGTLYYPSTAAVPINEKLPDHVVPRHLADEGFYVGPVPSVDPRNRNKMEHRLLNNTDLKWFCEDGSIVAMADPTRDVMMRPPFSDGDGPDLLTEHQKPILVSSRDTFRTLLDADSAPLQLNVDVGGVTFLHHHLFSREHVFASRLIQLCRQFHDRRQASSIELLAKRLEVLRNALVNVREALSVATNTVATFEPGPSGEGSSPEAAKNHSRKRLLEYGREARSLRQQLDHEERTDRSVLRVILRTWRQLRSLRDSQRYSNTQVQLQIVKTEVDKGEDLASWNRAIEAELEEEREDYVASYTLKLKVYEAELKDWRKWKKRYKMKTGELKDDADDPQSSVSDGKPKEKPQPPQPFDERGTRNRIQQKALQIRRRPGEPILYPELSNSNPVTPLEQCPSGEQRRRRDVTKCKVFVKVVFNEKRVSQTVTKILSQDFTVTFGEIFNLRIVHYPQSLILQIFEVSGVSTNPVAEVFLPVPKVDSDSDPSGTSFSAAHVVEDHEFSCDRVVSHNHEAVGSGVGPTNMAEHLGGSDPSEVSISAATFITSGILRCRASLTTDSKDSRPLPTEMNYQPEYASPVLTGDLTKLRQWLENTTIDPNDPANANLVQFLETGFSSSFSRDHFLLDQSQHDLDPERSSWDDFFEGRRFRAIQLRNEDVPEFRNLRMIPMRDEDVQRDPFIAYEKRIKDEQKPPEADDDDVDSYRRKFSKYLHKMREEVWKKYRYGKRPVELEDVVTEEQIPDIGSLGTTLLHWTERTRPLRPVRRERKKAVVQGIGGASRVAVIVNVANAFNVPVRKEVERNAKQYGIVRQPTSTSLIINEPLVRPVVEVTFQHVTVRTNASTGPNPCWNHDLQLEFRAPDANYSPVSLQTVREVIYFNLFDEVVVDILEDERDRDSHVHHRIEKRWLGTLQIPFSTLYLNTRIEGTFKVSCPPLLLGYNRDHSGALQQHPSTFGVNHGLIGPLEKDHTYLSIFLTLEPVLSLPEQIKENLESNESAELLAKADQFKRWYGGNFPRRQLKTTVVYVNGKSVFITRFLRELPPPTELVDPAETSNEYATELVARFVSLIPVVSDVVVFPGICDIWTTNDQFLSVLVGDQEEHAVLLCNYFLHLKLKAWLLLGFAVPDGPSIYVLTQDAMNYTAWNANTGESFNVQDSFCPIQSVGCLVNHENIWVNIQPVTQPSRMSFELHNPKNWRPFFDHKFLNPGLASIQPETLTYGRTEPAFVNQLADKIEITLRNQIILWRKRFRTSWNRHCGQVLRKILLKMEQSRIGTFNEDEIQSELYPILSVYKMCGFPLTMPYSEMTTISEAVFATGVHLTESVGVEFALAVHVHPYPHNVVAVWIYIASLYKR